MANKYSFYQLRMACQQHVLASLYYEADDPDAFHAGYVEAVTLKHTLLWCVTPWGQPDGWCLRRTEDIQQVFMGDDFEVRLQMLLEMDGVQHGQYLENTPPPDDDLLRHTLSRAHSKGDLVSVVMEDDVYTGAVLQLDDLRLSLSMLDFFGAAEGVRQFPLREIIALTIDTQEEKMYIRLRDTRLKLL
ncbi:MAG: hypothetical protein FWG37_03925 [Clostridia bacterium]|nr:hypothetical protein [Clostridia bacterium]